MSTNHLDRLHLNDWQELARSSQFNLDLLCLRLRISRRTLERYFSRKFSKSPAEWIRQCRLEASVRLLTMGFVAKEICTELGFTTETNFSHQFHRYFGLAPQEYIRRQSTEVVLRTCGAEEKRPSAGH